MNKGVELRITGSFNGVRAPASMAGGKKEVENFAKLS